MSRLAGGLARRVRLLEMIYTARQLDDLHKGTGANGQLVLPYGARLTPLAVDWAKSKKVAIGYSNIDAPKPTARAGAAPPDVNANLLWWCDGPCGAAKAAIAAQSRESALAAIDLPSDGANLVNAIKHIATEMKAGRIAAAILLVQSAAAAIVYANRCPSLRAVLGTCLETVEQGIRLVAANVLVVEYPHQALPQIKNLIGRFVRAASHTPPDEVQQRLKELASCG
jgi:hypothetical protein